MTISPGSRPSPRRDRNGQASPVTTSTSPMMTRNRPIRAPGSLRHARQLRGLDVAQFSRHPGTGALFHAFALELAAGRHDIAAAWGPDRRGIASTVDDLGEFLDLLPIGAFVRRARPGI